MRHVVRCVLWFWWLPLVAAVFGGCGPEGDPPPAVTLYCSVDEPIARTVLNAFTTKTGVPVSVKFDTEAGKATVLARRIRAEESNPIATVFWSGELFNTMKLAQEGLLEVYRPPAEGIPDRYKDPQGRWTAFGVRARVLAYNTLRVSKKTLPATWRGLSDLRWQGRLGVADPRFGTTGGHFAAMYVLWGEDEYLRFLDELAVVLEGRLQDGNATAARRVGDGALLLCATDTDDVYARQKNRQPVDMVYPDLGDGGTLWIPNSVGLVTRSSYRTQGRMLIDFLTSEDTERILAGGPAGNVPVRPALRESLKIEMPPETKVAFTDIAAAFDRAIQLAYDRLSRGEK